MVLDSFCIIFCQCENPTTCGSISSIAILSFLSSLLFSISKLSEKVKINVEQWDAVEMQKNFQHFISNKNFGQFII
jgi:hypothetical protein